MVILGIESSCDETAVAVVRDGREVISNELVSQVDIHKLYGGVVPEIASRQHIEAIDLIYRQALEKANMTIDDIDGIAVTFAPGLIGALLVGINFAKGLAFAAGKPLIPVHHIRGHAAANYLAFKDFEPPYCCLIVSGGHTLILGVDSYTNFRIIGSTRDDAAGEVFDKTARTLGLGYPGGALIDEYAKEGDRTKYILPRAKVDGAPYDMSFSGVKTAAINLIANARQRSETVDISSLAVAIQSAVSDSVVPRTAAAAKEYGYNKIAAAGGVAANSQIRADLERACVDNSLELFLPPLNYCGDNAAMIAAQGYYEFMDGITATADLNGYAVLPVSYR